MLLGQRGSADSACELVAGEGGVTEQAGGAYATIHQPLKDTPQPRTQPPTLADAFHLGGSAGGKYTAELVPGARSLGASLSRIMPSARLPPPGKDPLAPLAEGPPVKTLEWRYATAGGKAVMFLADPSHTERDLVPGFAEFKETVLMLLLGGATESVWRQDVEEALSANVHDIALLPIFQGAWLKRDFRRQLHLLTAAVARAEPAEPMGRGSLLTAMLSVHDPARAVKELEAQLRVLEAVERPEGAPHSAEVVEWGVASKLKEKELETAKRQLKRERKQKRAERMSKAMADGAPDTASQAGTPGARAPQARARTSGSSPARGSATTPGRRSSMSKGFAVRVHGQGDGDDMARTPSVRFYDDSDRVEDWQESPARAGDGSEALLRTPDRSGSLTGREPDDFRRMASVREGREHDALDSLDNSRLSTPGSPFSAAPSTRGRTHDSATSATASDAAFGAHVPGGLRFSHLPSTLDGSPMGSSSSSSLLPPRSGVRRAPSEVAEEWTGDRTPGGGGDGGGTRLRETARSSTPTTSL